MAITYLSHFLNTDTPAYGGETGLVHFEKIRSISKGDTSNNLKLTFPGHIGTHIDFPFHFSDTGKKCHEYPASFWHFDKVAFIECSVDEIIGKIEYLPQDIELLILKTGFGGKRMESEYWSSQPVLKKELAAIFKQKFPLLRVFGFDLISLTSKLNREEGKLAHRSFLIENEILVLEDMNLNDLNYCPVQVVIAPLQIEDADGVPCTVISLG
jgi:arylformamidase